MMDDALTPLERKQALTAMLLMSWSDEAVNAVASEIMMAGMLGHGTPAFRSTLNDVVLTVLRQIDQWETRHAQDQT